jgi:hypothetical protein
LYKPESLTAAKAEPASATNKWEDNRETTISYAFHALRKRRKEKRNYGKRVGKKEERREHNAPGTLAGQYPDKAGIASTVASRWKGEM